MKRHNFPLESQVELINGGLERERSFRCLLEMRQGLQFSSDTSREQSGFNNVEKRLHVGHAIKQIAF